MREQRPETSSANRHVELRSVEILPDGDGFVLELIEADDTAHRMALPSWTLHQLMRMLPRLDAALAEAREELTTSLIAYPVVRWDVERVGVDDAVALSLRTDRGVESGFLFNAGDASALHTLLGEALGAPAATERVKALDDLLGAAPPR